MAIIIVGGLIEKDNKFLLVQEAKEHCRGKWNIPAGRMENGESILDGAKREICEETGCTVELDGILEIGNIIMEDNIFISLIFSTKLVDENINYNNSEILDVKWFTYEEILEIKENLRGEEHILNAILAYRDNKIVSIDTIKILKEDQRSNIKS